MKLLQCKDCRYSRPEYLFLIYAWCLPLLPLVIYAMRKMATCKHPQATYDISPDYHRGKTVIKQQQKKCLSMRDTFGACGPDAKLFTTRK